jgi:hypothetical protein
MLRPQVAIKPRQGLAHCTAPDLHLLCTPPAFVLPPVCSPIACLFCWEPLQKVFSQRSDRVKSVELHPTEPWCGSCLPPHGSAPRTPLYCVNRLPRLHPSRWFVLCRILASLYNGHVYIWNYAEQVCSVSAAQQRQCGLEEHTAFRRAASRLDGCCVPLCDLVFMHRLHCSCSLW